MAARSYSQFCGLAASLDVLGDRWAMLIVRDLLRGPRRYTDLHRSLTGISTDMLARRLTELEDAGVVRRRKLPPPAAAKVYELTDDGRDLEPVLHSLSRWGLRRLTTDAYASTPVTAEHLEFALAAFYRPHGRQTRRRVRFRIDGHTISAVTDGDGLTIDRDAADDDPVDVEITGTARALVAALAGAEDALGPNDDTPRITGDDAAIAEVVAAFRVDDAGPPART